jgi:DNA mismatch endonuclease (patch repair protein)
VKRIRSTSCRMTQVRTPEASSPDVRRRMQHTGHRDTACELAIRSAVHRLGLRYRVDSAVAGTRTRADLAFASARVLVFIDGCFWHACPKHSTWPKANADWWREKIEGNARRDRAATERLRRNGWLVLRFWEHEDPQRAALRIFDAVTRRRRAARSAPSATAAARRPSPRTRQSAEVN